MAFDRTPTTRGSGGRFANGRDLSASGADMAAHTEIFLQPIAAPSILGLLGFGGATFIVAAHMAGWYGSTTTDLYLAPFAAFFGGLAQFLAGMWAYKARDGLATAMHGTWGAFWMAFGLLFLLAAMGAITIPTGTFPALGYWFIVLAVVTWVGTIAALAENLSLTGVLGFLALGSTLAAIYYLAGGGTDLLWAAGYSFVVSSVIALYTASGLIFQSVFGREVLPLGSLRMVPRAPRMAVGLGEPGVIHGQ
jgi:succinate-acetate transporter protein